MIEKIKKFFFWDYSDIEENILFKNEVQANRTAAITMGNECIVLLIAIFYGIITQYQRITLIAIESFVEMIIPATICFIFKGRKTWIKYTLLIGQLLVLIRLNTSLAIYTFPLLLVPIILACRYYKPSFTLVISFFTLVGMVLVVFFAFYTQTFVDLNLFDVEEIVVEGMVTVEEEIAISYWDYTYRVINYFLFPYFLIWALVCIVCVSSSIRGKKMIFDQIKVTTSNTIIESELSLATDIQANMLPNIFPAFPERQEFDVFAIMDPAKEVGGDFYDFFMIDNTHIAIIISDVSGKGIPAALVMVTAKTIIKDYTQLKLSPEDVFTRVNNTLCDGNKNDFFVTSWLGVIDLEDGILTYVNAGHNAPVICTKEGAKFIKQTPGFVLAGLDGIRYKQKQIKLCPGDKLLLYTDGVTEATNANNELYGNDRLINFINENINLDVYNVVKELKKDVEEFVGSAPQFDDMTMLSFEFKHYYGENHYISKTVLADVNELDSVLEFVENELEKNNCPLKIQTQIKIAIEELFVNICHYAYAPLKGDATIEIMINGGKAIIRITDGGMPFDPITKTDPDVTLGVEDREIGGLGIYMVKKTMDSMVYERKNNKNILTIEKTIL